MLWNVIHTKRTRLALFSNIIKWGKLALKKNGLINKSLGFIFIQIGCLGRCSTSFSNQVSSQRLTTHHLLKPQTSKFSNTSGRWLIAHMDTSSIKKKFLSMDFKPLQIRELQAFSNPLTKLYIRGSSLHRKAKATIKWKKYFREIPLVVRKTL